MTKDQVSQFLSAAEAADLKSYAFVSDISTSVYNDGSRHIIKVVDEMIYGIRSSKYMGSHNAFKPNIEVVGMWCEDAHECRIAGDYQQIKTFMENLGADLSEDDLKIMLQIDKINSDIIPVTGDYNNFKYLSDEEYAALSEEEKAAYDARKKEYEDHQKNYIGQNVAVGVRLGRDWN